MARDLEQAGRALDKARWVRTQRRLLKEAVQDGSVDPITLLRGDDEEWESIVRGMTVFDALKLVKSVGPGTALEILVELRLPMTIKVVGLSYQGREELARLLELTLKGDPPVPA